ncbi:hypothetical protein LTR35_010069 [Friedmanniomyces endolithicus]|uniref:Uncharacterized protein n=1 Tax=Friedmanniomyces endolithicus TaxID=329885 RepID=A0AAN6FTF4_9PEZI|nr:hypothetical protein LTR35_010069 [Friedmanniomyces endolithicus]KAK0298287.1 hypothetical protein LTS00_003252 [Friedmanniomyces endolithicus]KAK0323832.1 hypothetical protein LTR82_004952 [Friedmanniomyces endolithicus]KAK1015900.1 hypothetical protein LTR54_003629 [Friedmanniomyces endolithicus]
MNFTTIALAFMAILTLQMATLAVSKHHGPSSPCGKTCMRRLLYNTAYSSAASVIGMVMDVYDTKSYCSTDATESLCPDWVRQTVSDIASEMTKEKFRMLGATPSVTHYSFVQEMADVSREAALLGMSWASKTVTGIGEHNQAQYDSMAWTLHHLQTTKSTKVHAKKLRKAIANHPAGEPTPGSLKLDQTILLGSDTPSYILGPLMGGPGPCLDAILCSPDVFAVISPMLVGALDKGVLRKDAFLLYLLESAHGTSKVKRGGKPGEIYSFEYAKWLQRPSHGGQGHQIPPKNFDVDKPWHQSMETHQPELRPNVPGDTQMFRAEEFHHETGMVQNRIMQYERLSSLPDPRGQAGRMDRQSFREAGANGQWRTGDRFLNPRAIEDITESLWHGMDQQAEYQMLKTSGNEAILDSMGSPIVRKINRGKGRVHEILSMEPAEQAVRSDNGHRVQKFNVRDADGVKMEGINAWLDDLEHYAWESVRLGRNDRPPWELEGGPSSERPKDDPPMEHPSDSQPPKQDPPKQDPPEHDPPNEDPPADGPPPSSGDTSSPSSSPPADGDNPSGSDGDESNGLDVVDGDIPPLQLPPPLVPLPPPPPGMAPVPPPPGAALSEPDTPSPPDSPGPPGTESTDDTHWTDPDYVTPPGSAPPGSPPASEPVTASEPGTPNEPQSPSEPGTPDGPKPPGSQPGKPPHYGGPVVIPPAWYSKTHAHSSTSSGLATVTRYLTPAWSNSTSSAAVTTALPVSAVPFGSAGNSTRALGPAMASGYATAVVSAAKPSSASPVSSTSTRAVVAAFTGWSNSTVPRGSSGLASATGATTFLTVVQSGGVSSPPATLR